MLNHPRKILSLAVCNPDNPSLEFTIVHYFTKRELLTKLLIMPRENPVVFQVPFFDDCWGFVCDELGQVETLDCNAPLTLQPGILSQSFFEYLWEGIYWTMEKGRIMDTIKKKGLEKERLRKHTAKIYVYPN